MSSIFDEAFDFNAAAEQATTDRTAQSRQRYNLALGNHMANLKRSAMITGKRVELSGGDDADIFDAMASVIETGVNPSQAAVSGNDTQSQAVSSSDVIDSQVAGLEQDLRHAQEDYGRLQEDYNRLNEENGRLATSARRASDYLAQLEEANRQLLAANTEKTRLEGQVTSLTADLNTARHRRDDAETRLAEAGRNATQAPQPAPAPQQRQEQTAPAQPTTETQANQPQQPQRQRQANQPQQPQRRPAQQQRQEQTAPAQPTTDPASTRAMPTQSPAQPQQGRQRGLFSRIAPGHNRGTN